VQFRCVTIIKIEEKKEEEEERFHLSGNGTQGQLEDRPLQLLTKEQNGDAANGDRRGGPHNAQ
jgi:hypothetical protein